LFVGFRDQALAQGLGYTYEFLGLQALKSGFRSSVCDFCLAQIRGTRKQVFA
jgi:hypothetical protein